MLEVAMNLRWSWDQDARELFRRVDPKIWAETWHDPIRLLGQVSRSRLEELAADSEFMQMLSKVHGGLTTYRQSQRWFQRLDDQPFESVAYFSPEFGIAEALPQYSGGLGVLAGDHLKAASSLGIPLVGVGLFYRQGYFRQELDADGWQQERYINLDPHSMALEMVQNARVELDLAGTSVAAEVWKAEVGRIPLFLLDSDVEGNDEEGRGVTDRLYGGGAEHRLRQEILLGIGGVQALSAMGFEPQVFHTNEGHAGFLGLARMAKVMTEQGLTFDEAIEAVKASTVFTTHTPVPAGIDQFPRELMQKYFAGWADSIGVDFEDLMKLGHWPSDPKDAPFNMAVMGLRLAGRANAVSALHGTVSRSMFQPLWPGVPQEEVPIDAVTNGVHPPTWVSGEMSEVYAREVGERWGEADELGWASISEMDDRELWHAHEQCRERLINYVRSRLKQSALARGTSEADAHWFDSVLDPFVLTICWARRFASYKRPTLLLADLERLRGLLLDEDRPIQVIFAGKAHPADEIGKEMIRNIVHFARREDVRHRIAFIEDYDIAVARVLYQGADVWLNNPRRPFEACGTSGEKAALNGAINFSIQDGWWDEMFDGENGWTIASAEGYEDLERRDAAEAASLYEALESQIIPLFYAEFESGVPLGWVQKMKSSLASLGPRVSAARMMKDYVTQLYAPAAASARVLSGDGFGAARNLAAWKSKVRSEWSSVKIDLVDGNTALADLGTEREIKARVLLGDLSTEDVEVQLLHGVVAANDEMVSPKVEVMELESSEDGGFYRYGGTFTCETAGRYGFTVRAVPKHSDLTNFADVGCITWA